MKPKSKDNLVLDVGDTIYWIYRWPKTEYVPQIKKYKIVYIGKDKDGSPRCHIKQDQCMSCYVYTNQQMYVNFYKDTVIVEKVYRKLLQRHVRYVQAMLKHKKIIP